MRERKNIPIPVQEVGKAILKMLKAVGTMDEDWDDDEDEEGVVGL